MEVKVSDDSTTPVRRVLSDNRSRIEFVNEKELVVATENMEEQTRRENEKEKKHKWKILPTSTF